MTWLYEDRPIEALPDGCVGFVYIITNLQNQRQYVGKKLAKFRKTKPPLKGRINKRRSLVESDWRDYWGSNEHLIQDVQLQGVQQFRREILHICYSRGAMGYLEAREQFERKVLESDRYYNGIINVRVGGSPSLRQELQRHNNNNKT